MCELIHAKLKHSPLFGSSSCSQDNNIEDLPDSCHVFISSSTAKAMQFLTSFEAVICL